jgi:hypothetical protein
MAAILESSIDIDARPQDVWAVVADLRRMGQFSPQTKRMFVLGGVIEQGTTTINYNRDGWKVWPTSAKVTDFQPNKRIAFSIPLNGTIWSYTIEPTETGSRLTERREAPLGTTKISHILVDMGFGGEEHFEGVLRTGMAQTLAAVKRTVEAK